MRRSWVRGSPSLFGVRLQTTYLVRCHLSLVAYHLFFMTWYSAFALLGLVSGLLVATVMAISRHKKLATGEIRLIGASALVHSALSPEGAVLISGELWRARSMDGTSIAPHSRVHVVELDGHLLLVERDS